MLRTLILFLPLIAFAQDEKRVIGVDQRTQVLSHTDAFTRTVGLLQRKGSGFCTATLIDSLHILTNAHCVVKGTRKFPTVLHHPSVFTFIPGMLGPQQNPGGSFKIKRIDIFKKFLSTGSSTHDIAVLELTRPAGLPTIGRLRVDKNISIDHTAMKITGYSSQRPYGTMWEGAGILLEADYSRNLMTHDTDTLPGTSGALMRIRRGRGWVAVGVHRGPIGPYFNNGVIFTPEIFDAINRWVKN